MLATIIRDIFRMIFSRFHMEEFTFCNLQLLNQAVFKIAYFRYRYMHPIVKEAFI